MRSSKYAADLPYPTVSAERTDYHDANCIREDYGGSESETTAIMQYVYQSYICASDEELHNMFIGIAMVEMHHHDLLGETLCKLGDKPIIAGRRRYWNAGVVNYATCALDMINNDIMAEKQAICNYRKTIKCLNNISIIELIERIILDEELHVELLESMRNRLLSRDT